jgi:hypothetical protein
MMGLSRMQSTPSGFRRVMTELKPYWIAFEE